MPKKYENLSWKTITTKAQKKRQQQKAIKLDQHDDQEQLDKKFSSKPYVKKPRGRPRKNLLRNFEHIPF